jgi:23S rRNA pseudouridine1911/1915/1917 synthase
MRLIELLKARGLSNREARGYLITGKVSVDGMPTIDGGREVSNHLVVVDVNAPRLQPGKDLMILRRDADVAIVYKPAGLLAVPAPGRHDVSNVLASVHAICGSAYAVHRLDEPTSGLMMVALNEVTQKGLKDQLFEHNIERGYLALVQRQMPRDPFEVRNHLVRDRGDGKRGSGEGTGAKAASTAFECLERLPGASVVAATLETGRTHQVRIHLAEMRYPVLGDNLYGGKGVARRAPRLALHAARLTFQHPRNGETWAFRIPLADDLEALRRRIKTPPEKTARRKRPAKKHERKPSRRKKS